MYTYYLLLTTQKSQRQAQSYNFLVDWTQLLKVTVYIVFDNVIHILNSHKF